MGGTRWGPSRAGNGIRTRDIKLGKLALYQLSYARLTSEGNLQKALRRVKRCAQSGSRYTESGMAASGTDSPETERGANLYFFPDQPVSADELRRLLREGSPERQAWAISHLLRYADWEDIWSFTTREQVRIHFASLALPPSLSAAWARMLKVETAEVRGE